MPQTPPPPTIRGFDGQCNRINPPPSPMAHQLRGLFRRQVFKKITRFTLLATVFGFLAPLHATTQHSEEHRFQLPDRWQAPLPHQGDPQALSNWWHQLSDPALLALVQAAQDNSATLAQAASRIAEARANAMASNANLWPNLQIGVNRIRTTPTPGSDAASQNQLLFQTQWEIDLFGGQRAQARSADLQLQAAKAQWHEARVSVAAELAGTYFNWRLCLAQASNQRQQVQSLEKTAELILLATQAGLQTPMAAQMAQAQAALAQNQLIGQDAECLNLVKALVALTALPETDLISKIQNQALNWPQGDVFNIDALPAKVLMQRPDLAAAQRQVIAAQAQIAQADATRYPLIGLTGQIGPARFNSGSSSQSGLMWSFGPLSVSLPLVDHGVRQARIEAATATYEAAVVNLKSHARQAIREVEEALVLLHSTRERAKQADRITFGLTHALHATQAKRNAGLANALDLEEALRSQLQAQVNQLALERDRILAWISLYRAAGGGWSAESQLSIISE